MGTEREVDEERDKQNMENTRADYASIYCSVVSDRGRFDYW